MDPINVDVKYLTPRELKDIMDNSGLSGDDLENPMSAEDPGAALAAIAWVVARRDNPDLTLEDAWDIPIALEDKPPDPISANS